VYKEECTACLSKEGSPVLCIPPPCDPLASYFSVGLQPQSPSGSPCCTFMPCSPTPSSCTPATPTSPLPHIHFFPVKLQKGQEARLGPSTICSQLHSLQGASAPTLVRELPREKIFPGPFPYPLGTSSHLPVACYHICPPYLWPQDSLGPLVKHVLLPTFPSPLPPSSPLHHSPSDLCSRLQPCSGLSSLLWPTFAVQ
jgi:hypothetical protein